MELISSPHPETVLDFKVVRDLIQKHHIGYSKLLCKTPSDKVFVTDKFVVSADNVDYENVMNLLMQTCLGLKPVSHVKGFSEPFCNSSAELYIRAAVDWSIARGIVWQIGRDRFLIEIIYDVSSYVLQFTVGLIEEGRAN